MSEKTKNNRIWWVLTGSTLLYLAIVADSPNFIVAIPSIQDYFSAASTGCSAACLKRHG